jgi:hypothetical protein
MKDLFTELRAAPAKPVGELAMLTKLVEDMRRSFKNGHYDETSEEAAAFATCQTELQRLLLPDVNDQREFRVLCTKMNQNLKMLREKSAQQSSFGRALHEGMREF